jgi:hypothetical protein
LPRSHDLRRTKPRPDLRTQWTPKRVNVRPSNRYPVIGGNGYLLDNLRGANSAAVVRINGAGRRMCAAVGMPDPSIPGKVQSQTSRRDFARCCIKNGFPYDTRLTPDSQQPINSFNHPNVPREAGSSVLDHQFGGNAALHCRFKSICIIQFWSPVNRVNGRSP